MRAPTAILLAAAVISLPSLAQGQARVTQIVGPDGSTTDVSDDIELIPFGMLKAGVVKQGTELGIGDELRAKSGRSVVVLECSDTAGITLESGFRAVIMQRPQGKACFLDLFAGAAHVVGDTSTGLGAGEVMLGAERTHYSLTVSRDREGVRRDLQVFDGEVEVRPGAGASAVDVRAGTGLVVGAGGAGEYATAPISSRQIERAAHLYAYVDASRTKADTRRTAYNTLYSAYREVLAKPDSAALRLNLVAEQVRYEATSKTTLYQIERAKVSAPQTSQLQATTSALTVAAYTQLGDEAKATANYEALRGYDAQTLQSALQTYHIDPELIRRAGRFDARVNAGIQDRVLRPEAPTLTPQPDTLQVRAGADPELIDPGGRSRIVVRVSDESGAAVAGAKVWITAGGGEFYGGGTEVQGTTDANGVFDVVWSCANCAAGYVFSVRVSMEGFAAAETKVGLRVR